MAMDELWRLAGNQVMTKKRTTSGDNQAIAKAGKGGTIPPVEHRWKAGDPSPNPKGRPRTISDLKAHIQEMSEQGVGATDVTRLDLLLRAMFQSKSAADRLTILRYGWGNVPQPVGGSDDLGPIQIEITPYNYDSAVARIAARPNQDSQKSPESDDSGNGQEMG